MNWKRLICLILRHKWEYIIRIEWDGKTRGCRRCDKREAQINSMAIKCPGYWHHIGYEWADFKENIAKFDARKPL